MDSSTSLPPITEDDIAQFLVNTPDFFERHAEVLASVQLTSPHGQRAVSLQERQAEMLREKIRHLELKAAEMIRYGQENVVISDHLHRWARGLFMVRDPAALPDAVVQGLQGEYQLPQAAIRLWDLHPDWADASFSAGVSADARDFAQSLVKPYCGPNPGLEAAQWLPEPAKAASLALLPLRAGPEETAFGLLVLASDDPRRFHVQMGTAFVERIAELAAASLTRLLP